MNIEKIEKSAKTMKIIWGLISTLLAGVYGFCIYIYQSKMDVHDNTIAIKEMREEIKNHKRECSDRFVAFENEHRSFESRIMQNAKNTEMTAAKIEVSLTKISADLQFIKENLMRKGMER